MLDIFAKSARHDPVKNALAATFLPELVEVIKTYFDQKAIVKNGVVG